MFPLPHHVGLCFGEYLAEYPTAGLGEDAACPVPVGVNVKLYFTLGIGVRKVLGQLFLAEVGYGLFYGKFPYLDPLRHPPLNGRKGPCSRGIAMLRSDGEDLVFVLLYLPPERPNLLRSEEHTSELQSQSNLV